MLRIVPHTVPRVGRTYERRPQPPRRHQLPRPRAWRRVNLDESEGERERVRHGAEREEGLGPYGGPRGGGGFL